MPWPQTGATHYHAQLGLQNKGRAIQGMKVGYTVWLGSIIFGIDRWTSAQYVVWSLVVVRMAVELKYQNTPYRFIQLHIK